MFNIKGAMNIGNITPLSTGYVIFDILIGGIPKGRITHIFSPDGVGKTTLSLYLISNMMLIDLLNSKEPYFFYLDCEQAFNEIWFKNNFYPLEINIEYEDEYAIIKTKEDNFEIGVIIQPMYYEDIDVIFDKAIEYIIKNKKCGYLLWDSVIKPITRKFEKDTESLAFRSQWIQIIIDKYLKAIGQSNLTCIFINQIRDKFATNFFEKDISGETEDINKHVPGGWALKFASSLSITLLKKRDFEYGGNIEERSNPFYISGKIINIKSGKNRIRSAGITGELTFIKDYGFSQIVNSYILLHPKERGNPIGNVNGRFLGIDKEIRFDKFIENIEEYIDSLLGETIKQAIIRFSFNSKDKIEFIKNNLKYYKFFYEKDGERLKQKAKEFAGININEFLNNNNDDNS